MRHLARKCPRPIGLCLSLVFRLSLSFHFVHHPAERTGLCGLHKGRDVGNSRECRDISVLIITAPLWLFRSQPNPGYVEALSAISAFRFHIWRAYRYYIEVISLWSIIQGSPGCIEAWIAAPPSCPLQTPMQDSCSHVALPSFLSDHTHDPSSRAMNFIKEFLSPQLCVPRARCYRFYQSTSSVNEPGTSSIAEVHSFLFYTVSNR